MTKQQIIDTVAIATQRPKAEVETTIDSLLGEIGKALRSGERVDLRGFGSFTVKDKKARQGRNPKTGETIQIAARKAAAFKPSKEVSDRLAAESSATTGQA
jgi:DNA-binding protein HU-beta